ncbi:response regulator transcription factor [Spirochaeta cellobiosiphila]|uniref:response regulator transcription factor n=1 Tax=Spirochaeta cellobiosiphila TaxID=504483 RepID=UPI0004239F0E|nr:response regulator [Spirochaeta cellobiosiphila]
MNQKILIVDDEPINLEFFEVMLTKLGFTVALAHDGEEALDKVREVNPELIILDNIMPKLTGWEVTRLIKKDPRYTDYKDIPIIMFSALDAAKDKIEGFELGIEDYITKPFNFSEVLARIRAVLRHRELSKSIVHKERRITLIESFNKSLTYFTQALREPVESLLQGANNLDTSNLSDVEQYVSQVKDECKRAVAALEGLDEEISDLKSQGDKLKENEISVEELERRFQKHLNGLKEGQENISVS